MKPARLLAELRERGAVVEARGERLHIDGPEDVLKPQVLEAARRHKPALMELLLLEAATKPQVLAAAGVGELSHHEERAVALAHERGATAGGWPLEVDAGAIYRAHNITEAQVLGGGS